MIYGKNKRQCLMVGNNFIRYVYFGNKQLLTIGRGFNPVEEDDRIYKEGLIDTETSGWELIPGGKLCFYGVCYSIHSFKTNYYNINSNPDLFELVITSWISNETIFRYKVRIENNPQTAPENNFDLVFEVFDKNNVLLFTHKFNTQRYFGLNLRYFVNYNFTNKRWEIFFPKDKNAETASADYLVNYINEPYEPCYMCLYNLNTINMDINMGDRSITSTDMSILMQTDSRKD